MEAYFRSPDKAAEGPLKDTPSPSDEEYVSRVAGLNLADPGVRPARPATADDKGKSNDLAQERRHSLPIIRDPHPAGITSRSPRYKEPTPLSDTDLKRSSMPSGLSIFDTDDPFGFRSTAAKRAEKDDRDDLRDLDSGRWRESSTVKKKDESLRDLAAFLKETGPEDFHDESPGRSHFVPSSLKKKLTKMFLKQKKSFTGSFDACPSLDSVESSSEYLEMPAVKVAYGVADNYGPRNALRRISVSSYDSFLYSTNEKGKLTLKDAGFAPRSILKNPVEIPVTRPRSMSLDDVHKPASRIKAIPREIDEDMGRLFTSQDLALAQGSSSVRKARPPYFSASTTVVTTRTKRVKFVVPNTKDVHYFLDSDAGKAARRTYSLQPAFDRSFTIPTPSNLTPRLQRQFLRETFVDSEGFQVTTVFKPGMRHTGEFFKGKPLYYVLGSLDTFFLEQESSGSSDFGFNVSSDDDILDSF